MNGTCCSIGLYCLNSMCATDNMGGNCSTSANCYPPATKGEVHVGCVNSMCQYVYGLGDTCTNTTDCVAPLTCSNSSMCSGAAQNASCAATVCNFGLYCELSNVTCTPVHVTGSSCAYSSQCALDNICYNGNCTAAYSQAAGKSCTDEMTCATGLTCASNGTCVAVMSDLVSCTANANCTNGLCLCSLVTGNSYCFGSGYMYDPCTDESSSLLSCLEDNSCSTATDAPNSCCYANCLSDYKKTFSCGCSFESSFFGGCFYNQYCGGFPVWAIIVIIVVAIVLVLGVVLLVFFMMRRRRHYDTI